MASTTETAVGEKRSTARVHYRDKKTSTRVKVTENIAKWVISVGGVLVIGAVVGIMVFLIQVVIPLFGSNDPLGQVHYQLDAGDDIIWVNADEFQSLATTVDRTGNLTTFHVPTGEIIARDAFDFDGRAVTAVAGILDRNQVAFGFEDGSLQFGQVDFSSTSTAQANAPADLVQLTGRDYTANGLIYAPVQTGDFRTIRPVYELGEPVEISQFPIVAVDYRVGGTVERPTLAYVTVDSAGVVRVSRTTAQRNLMTNEETLTTTTTELPNLDLAEDVSVTRVLMSSGGDRVFVGTDDGYIFRYDLRNLENPVLAERRPVFDEEVAVTSMTFLSGEIALAVGGSDGSVDVFFRLQRPGIDTADGYEMVRSRVHASQGTPIVEMSEARRDKSLVTMGANGSVWVRHSTSDQVLFEFERRTDPSLPATVMIFPRSDGVLLVDREGGVDAWQYNARHGGITLDTLFGQIWYEGYSQPNWVWQSTAATDLFEPKYSLVPLIFGTLKAAFYAMLFATPIALMGAIYTSEFVHTGVRATVKPVMELMESLPTVVLGFIAALVLAPIVEEWISAVLLGFIAVPLGLMIGAFSWQMLPIQTAIRFDGLPKFALMIFAIIATAFVAYQLGPVFEDLLFYGNFMAWANNDIGTGTPFMFLLQLPLAYMIVAWSFKRFYGHYLRDRLRAMDRPEAGRLDALRWLGFLGGAIVLSYAVASFLTLIGFDPRGGIVDTYAQRNALIVGFVMAFAVIPNIYTLAEDALNAVPSHLRSGSLASGATPWQTAMWIVLPTAASGVFSAVMIGMGRAVGETMIVVMAAGNTPIMEWNIFSGLRTLSANIAIELPEAVRDGTNYRVLFLAALTLFIMTFVINTVAELIRQRFRKRAFQL
ncbi:ABC transporter permease subunit [Pelagibacterium lentulum]|uniref:ABC transmembrane type-1 domain-containing protein n=1 Tax=Pelagibacterium lentulum TaxID=2029865 RepID=A0A916W0Y8_9HYPH|nr:ABC transporter permease subunit [Pelagibacterium lentulum]GGA57305.1 hypothetical protein GCM10011499_29440 [Pelagibacterium lentulum]